MSITGALADFSLPEIFQFIDKGHKSGLLTLRTFSNSQAASPIYYLWVNQGRIVAAANQSNEQGLIALINQYQWVSNHVVNKLAQFCPSNKPLGLYLRSQGVLQVEQIEHLFQVQIVQQVCCLFELKDGLFEFEQNVATPMREMTGLSVPAGILKGVWQKLIILKRRFELRRFSSESSGVSSSHEDFCQQLILILDIAFFHSLNFSLFDTNNSLTKIYQLFDLYDRPYDLPKSIKLQTISCTNQLNASC